MVEVDKTLNQRRDQRDADLAAAANPSLLLEMTRLGLKLQADIAVMWANSIQSWTRIFSAQVDVMKAMGEQN